MSLNEYVAIRYTPFFAKKVPWVSDLEKITMMLGFKSSYPSAKDFVRAVHKWQARHGLKADGLLGPKTFSKMKPALIAGTNGGYMGPDPEWVSLLKNYELATNPPPPRISTHSPIAPSAEDKVIQEMLEVIKKQHSDPYLAIEVSAAYVNDQMRSGGVDRITTGITLVPSMEVGQKWVMKAGTRIVLSIHPGGSGSGGAEILFMTDSGRTYTQTLKGWASDATAAFFTDLAKDMKPIKLLLDVEAYLLMGAASATGFTGFAVIAAGNATQWVLNNKEKLASWINAVQVISRARRYMKVAAPTLWDKVVAMVLSKVGDVFGEISDSAFSDPKNIARTLGGIFYKVGKMVVLRDFKVLGTIISFLLAAVMMAVRAVPGAIELTKEKEKEKLAQDIVQKLKEQGISVSLQEGMQIIQEIAKNPDETKRYLEEIQQAIADLK